MHQQINYAFGRKLKRNFVVPSLILCGRVAPVFTRTDLVVYPSPRPRLRLWKSSTSLFGYTDGQNRFFEARQLIVPHVDKGLPRNLHNLSAIKSLERFMAAYG